MRPILFFSLMIILAALCATPAAAQCPETWAAEGSQLTVNGAVSASIMWDPDGPGPLPPRLVVAGFFSAAGDSPAANIAMWDGAQWQPIGSGLNGPAYALAVLPTGELVVGGSFTAAGGAPAIGVASWNGTAWSALGAGVASVNALLVRPSGELIAAGVFTTSGSSAVNRIASWNGTSWAPLGSGLSDLANALVNMPDGSLVVGGQFATAGGVPAQGVARWDGTAWSAVGPGMTANQWVGALAVMPNGDLVAGGGFSFTANGSTISNIARWNGSTWSPMSQLGPVRALAVAPDGTLFAGGIFSTLVQWADGGWLNAGSGEDFEIDTITCLPGGGVFAGGQFTLAGGTQANAAAVWDGASWSALGNGILGDVQVRALAPMPNGDIVAGGWFTHAGGVRADRVARWNGATWSPMGQGLTGSTAPMVYALAVMPDGDVVAGGFFTSPANAIARWNGTAWSALGAGIYSGRATALTVLPSGDLIAGGSFVLSPAGIGTSYGVVRWNGSAWSALGTGIPNGTVEAMVVMPNGDLVVGGSFSQTGNGPAANIARWNGTNWTNLGAGISTFFQPPVYALAAFPNGDLIAGGFFTTAGGAPATNIARWNGASWTSLTSGVNGPTFPVVNALAVMPSGELIVGGEISLAGPTNVHVNNIARWDGATWSPIGNGLTSNYSPEALSMALLPSGDLCVGGKFSMAGAIPVSGLARITTHRVCAADFNCSGGLEVQDIFDFLSSWFAGDPAADFNAAGGITVQDIFDFLAAWFAGCH